VPVDPTTILLAGTASGRFAAKRIKVGTNGGSSQYTTLTMDTMFTVQNTVASCSYCYVGSTPDSTAQPAAIRTSDGRILLVGGTSNGFINASQGSGFDAPDGTRPRAAMRRATTPRSSAPRSTVRRR
jgi:hypothetical protein